MFGLVFQGFQAPPPPKNSRPNLSAFLSNGISRAQICSRRFSAYEGDQQVLGTTFAGLKFLSSPRPRDLQKSPGNSNCLLNRSGRSSATTKQKTAIPYHLAKQDGILTKLVWACNFRICNAMGLPMKLRERSTFEYVMQPSFSGSQVPEMAIFR